MKTSTTSVVAGMQEGLKVSVLNCNDAKLPLTSLIYKGKGLLSSCHDTVTDAIHFPKDVAFVEKVGLSWIHLRV